MNSLGEPGGSPSYSNLGPTVAVAMLEKITGRTYESWLKGAEGRTIGLRTPMMLNPSAVKDEDVFPHYIQNGKIVQGGVDSNKYLYFDPAGGLAVSLIDLCNFAQFTFSGANILGNNVFKNLISFRNKEQTTTYGGWSGDPDQWLTHGGATGRGELCIMWTSPRWKSAFIFFTNAAPSDGTDLMSPIIGDINSIMTNLPLEK